jgi:NAD kinase
MTESRLPRVVLVTRASDYERLLADHATRGQAEFFLRSRGRDISEVEGRHHRFVAARDTVAAAIPHQWRRAAVDRNDLDRFLFEDDDVIVAVGQDGLIPNVAKYLHGQPVIGINPDPDLYEGVLARHQAGDAAELIRLAATGRARLEQRMMAEAVLDDGTRLLALNEVFVGHRSHQSARYRIIGAGQELRQISSGLIVSTDTGSTGWARSISLERHSSVPLPRPGEARLSFFIREPFPASGSQITLSEGQLDQSDHLTVWSEMDVGGTVFADGIETDALPFDWGRRVDIHLAEQHLGLVEPAEASHELAGPPSRRSA